MVNRRTLLAAAAWTVASPDAIALPVPRGDRLAFRLIRHGSEIGTHTISFDQRGNALTVHIAVEAAVSLLSVRIVHYTHQATETWQDGKLVALTGATNKNGTPQWMEARRTPEGLLVRGSQTAQYIAPEAAIGTSYWNRRMMDGPMISLEDGVLLHPKVVPSGNENIPLASGATISAEHYNLSGSFNVDVWYDQTNTWAGLALTVADHSNVHYERL
jgi:hypothetical protein